jgi:mRNA-degrading endonuclease RelE of RelBE toxin-antitoxin system
MINKLQRSAEFARNLRKLPREVRARARKQLKLLMQDFWYPSLHTEKLEGETYKGQPVWSIRVDRKHRIKFIIRKEEQAYYLIAIGKHDIYRRG